MSKKEQAKQQKATETQSHLGISEYDSSSDSASASDHVSERPNEIGGRRGLDPTRYGDWEKNGRCIDF